MTMTAVTSLAAMVTVPFVVFLALDHFVGADATAEMSMVGVALRMFAIVALPVALDPACAVPAAIYSLLVFATALGFVALVRGRSGAVAARTA